VPTVVEFGWSTLSGTSIMLDDYKVKTGDPHNLIEDKVAEEAAYAVGNPSYKDLAEENAYLRSERSQLYDELARVTSNDVQVRGDSTRDEVIESLERELTKEKDQNIRLGGQFDYLKSEIAHLQFHGSEQAAVAKSLEERLEGSQECLHAANAELLQILPLRIKINDLRQKTENISADVLAANNDKHQLIQERDRLKSSLDAVTHSMETAQGKLMSSSRKAQDLKIEKSGELD
jgi:chromosome segregation ATPase